MFPTPQRTRRTLLAVVALSLFALLPAPADPA